MVEAIIGAAIITFAATQRRRRSHMTLAMATGLLTAAVVFAAGRLV